MRKFWILLLLVLLVSAALVLPAAAAKGGTPPGLKVTVEPIDEPIDDNHPGRWLPWIAGIGDRVYYRVTVTNNGPSATITNVTDSLGTGLACVSAEGCPNPLATGGVYVYESQSPYTVGPEYDNLDELENKVTVQAEGNRALTAMAEMNVGHYPDCADNLGGGHYDPADYPNYHVCRWTPGKLGFWRITLTPDGPGPLSVMLTLRDHVPGNWCVMPDQEGGPSEEGGVVQIRKWRTGTVVLVVYLPANGVCLKGGHGGELFGDGNASHFYLMFSVAGTLEAEFLSPPLPG